MKKISLLFFIFFLLSPSAFASGHMPDLAFIIEIYALAILVSILALLTTLIYHFKGGQIKGIVAWLFTIANCVLVIYLLKTDQWNSTS